CLLTVIVQNQYAMIQERYRSCIAACYAYADACDHCATACLQEDHVKAMATCIHLDRFCAEICRLAASFIAHTSGVSHDGYVKDLCRLCAQVCEDCGAACEQHEAEDCKACAAACRQCAMACREMAA